ncbi:MAG: TlpA family protein disulfide reductase [Blastocatellia bacterium]
MSRGLKSFALAFRVFTASCLLVLFSVAATPHLGASDIPELPMPDGSGDTPEMVVDLLNVNLGPVANRQDKLKLSSLRGRVVLIDMFWSKCHHCEEHAPHIVELYNQYRSRGFSVLGLATDRKEKKDEVESAKAFVAKAKINYPVGFLSTEVIAYYMDSHDHGVPQMVLFGPDGKMAKRQIGWSDKIGKEMRAAIEAQLAKLPTVKPGSKASTKNTARKSKQV